jgi:hypothetical protein
MAPINGPTEIGVKPAAGVMPTRPEMMPEQAPMMENFLVWRYSRRDQVIPPLQAARSGKSCQLGWWELLERAKDGKNLLVFTKT